MDDAIGHAEAMLGLVGFRVLEVDRAPAEMTVIVETTADVAGCSTCGVRGEAQDRLRVDIGDLPRFGRTVRLVWLKRRWRCSDDRLSGEDLDGGHRTPGPPGGAPLAGGSRGHPPGGRAGPCRWRWSPESSPYGDACGGPPRHPAGRRPETGGEGQLRNDPILSRPQMAPAGVPSPLDS